MEDKTMFVIKTTCMLGLLSLLFLAAKGSDSMCQDIDHFACESMATKNPNMCSEPVLRSLACPAFCNNCPATCYNCNTTTADVTGCNTATCADGEMCLLQTVSQAGSTPKYNMMCGAKSTCSLLRKRSSILPELQSRDTTISLKCCDQNLCNDPSKSITSTTSPATTKTITTTSMNTWRRTLTTRSPTKSPIKTTRVTITTSPHTKNCKRDIIIMVEDTVHMKPYFDEVRLVLEEVIRELSHTRVALGTFNTVGKTVWDFKSYLDMNDLLSAVNGLSSSNMVASAADNFAAVNHVLNYFKLGNRDLISDVVIFFTVGHIHASNGRYFAHAQGKRRAAIEALHQTSNDVISIGFGEGNGSGMHAIATDLDHFINIPDPGNFDKVNDSFLLASKLLKLICY